MYSIDLNSDMGESFGAYKLGGDEEIIKYVTTANVACGWHAGDPMVMDKVVRMAKERGTVFCGSLRVIKRLMLTGWCLCLEIIRADGSLS